MGEETHRFKYVDSRDGFGYDVCDLRNGRNRVIGRCDFKADAELITGALNACNEHALLSAEMPIERTNYHQKEKLA